MNDIHSKDKSHIRLTYVTNYYLNQADASSIMDLLGRYEKYAPELLDRIQFVIVDDGSPVEYTIPDFNLNITWLKITEDIPWNHGGARNLGITYAKSDKVLMTDLDREFPEETLAEMVRRRECGRNFYKVRQRDEKTGQIKRGHPNTFLISRARFMRFFGFDEEFCGHYGAEDYRFVKIQKYHGSRQLYLNKKYTCFSRKDIDREKSYHSLARDLSYNTPIDARKKQETEQYGAESGYSRIFLNFTWKILKESYRPPCKREKRVFWKHFWHWRWLTGYW